MVVLCNVAEVPEATARSLAGFVTAGDSSSSSPEIVSVSRLWLAKAVRHLPGPGARAPDPGVFRCSTWQPDHPIFRPFDQPEHGDLRMLRFDRMTRLVPDPQARVLAMVEGTFPLLVESSVGRGRCLLVAVPADNQWGDWAIQRLIFP